MNEIFDAIGDAISSIFDNPVIKLGIQLAVIYWVILWLAAAYWAFRDMQSRSDNPLAPYLAAAFVIVFTPILFPLAVFTYRWYAGTAVSLTTLPLPAVASRLTVS